nr:DUF1643 domain-containing protein [Paracoccus laeviglucosivorans]
MSTITRRHREGDRRSSAVFSRCGCYRFALTRIWADGPRLTFVMLNPSTADHRRNDPTIARCETRARDEGAGAFRIVNLFAWRATFPAELRSSPDPVGPGNDAAIRRAALWSDRVICAWGAHGALAGRDVQVQALLCRTGRPLLHLGLTQAGAPRHPLYCPRNLPLSEWS